MKYNAILRNFAGPFALLPKTFSFLPPDDAGGGGGDDTPSPLLAALFGQADQTDDTTPAPAENVRGATLYEAIAGPSDEEKKAADDKAKADADAKAKEESDKKAAEDKAKADEAANKAAAEAAAAQPIKGTKRKTQAELDAEAKAKTEADAAAKKQAEQQDWEKTLLDEERDQLELARFAESKFGDKYKGLAAKVDKFIRENAAKVDADDFDADAPEYREWVEKNRPALSNSEIRIIERARGEAIGDERAKKTTEEVLDRTYQMVQQPIVKAEADAYYAKAAGEVMPDDVAVAFKESPAKAREQFPFEYGIVEEEMNRHADAVEELLALTRVNPDTKRVLKPYDAKNPVHVAAVQIVQSVDEQFKKAGGADLVRNGKTFLPRAELARVPADKQGQYWTFTSREIAERSTALVKARIGDRIKAENERLSKLGFERRKPAAAAPAAPSVAPAKNQPAPRPAPIGGGGGGGGPQSATDRLLAESGMSPA